MKTAQKYENYKNEKDLPLMLKTKDIAEVMGINYNKALELVKREDFPSIKLAMTYHTPRSAFFQFLEKQAMNNKSLI